MLRNDQGKTFCLRCCILTLDREFELCDVQVVGCYCLSLDEAPIYIVLRYTHQLRGNSVLKCIMSASSSHLPSSCTIYKASCGSPPLFPSVYAQNQETGPWLQPNWRGGTCSIFPAPSFQLKHQPERALKFQYSPNLLSSHICISFDSLPLFGEYWTRTKVVIRNLISGVVPKGLQDGGRVVPLAPEGLRYGRNGQTK